MSALRDTYSNSRVKQGRGPRSSRRVIPSTPVWKTTLPLKYQEGQNGVGEGRGSLSLINIKIHGLW